MSNSPIVLKTTGGTFWTLAPGLDTALASKVTIYDSKNVLRFSGNVVDNVKPKGSYVKVKVQSSEFLLDDGDVIVVVVTITNDGTTIVSGDDVIIDDGPGLVTKSGTATRSTKVSKVAKTTAQTTTKGKALKKAKKSGK